MEYNDCIHIEKIDKEYKTFSLNIIQPKLSIEECEKLCYENKFIFSKNVEENIYGYIEKYVPRYICGYLNSNINGSLYIGVDNDGYIKGIPYQGIFPQDKIKEYIYEIIDKNIASTDKSNIKSNISINIINIHKPSKPIISIHSKFIDYIDKKKEYDELITIYKQKILEKKRLIKLFDNKLINIYNTPETRLLLIDYIKEQDPNNIVLKLLDEGHQLSKIDGEIIKIIKYDSNNPYYWVTKFKDIMIKKINSNKIDRIPYFKEMYLPFNLIRSVNDMIPYWMHYNDNMNLYLIHIIINKDIQTKRKIIFDNCNSEKKYKTSYFNIKTNEWSESYRLLDCNGEPMCSY